MNFPIEDNIELSNDKNNILRTAYKTSSICVITGAAGTGKTRLIHEYIKLNADKRILCLTTTNTAKNNLKGEYGNNVIYKNTSENWKQSENYDFIIIDEAGFVSTEKMRDILNYNQDSNYLIVGDPFKLSLLNLVIGLN